MASTQHYNDWPNAVGFDTVYEEHEPVELQVKGHIPAYAAGTLFRTGIGPRSVTGKDGKVIFKSHHWFDAFSQVHRFQLHTPGSTAGDPDAGIERVTYNSRLTSDALIAHIQKTGKMDKFNFAAKYEPCKSFFHKLQSIFHTPPQNYDEPAEINNAVTMSINYPGLSSNGTSDSKPHDRNSITTLCNKTDANRLQFLDPATLKPTGLVTQAKLHPALKGPLSAAHPCVDPVTGDTYNYNLDFTGLKATYHVFVTSGSTGETSILATLTHPGAYLHSFFMTANFVVLCVWNSHFSKAGASIMWNRNLLDAMYFNTSPAAWFVIDRRPTSEGGHGLVAQFTSDPFFAFHTINAYEVPNSSGDGTVDLLCDVTTYDNTDVIHHFYLDNLISDMPTAKTVNEKLKKDKSRYDHVQPHLRRYRISKIPLPTTFSTSDKQKSSAILSGKATIDFSAPTHLSPELPTHNPELVAKPYRYVYGTLGTDPTKSTFTWGLVKYDLQTQTAKTWEVKGHTPGEPIFVPRPRSEVVGEGEGKEREEDDGVLLTVVLDGYESKSYLLCLDARDLREVGRVEVDGVVGFGFHGIWTSRL